MITIIVVSLIVISAIVIGSLQYSLKLGFAQGQGQQQLTSQQEKNKALVKEFFDEVFFKKNVSAVDKFYPNNFVSHAGFPSGLTDKGFHKQAYSRALSVFPDLNGRIDDILAEGDKVVAFTTWNGTAQPANKPVSFKIADLFRIDDGKIVEHWEVSDYRKVDKVLGENASNPFRQPLTIK